MRKRVLEVLEDGPQLLADLVVASGMPLRDVRHSLVELVRDGTVTCTRVAPPGVTAENGANDRARLLWHLAAHPRPTACPRPAAPRRRREWPSVRRDRDAARARQHAKAHTDERPDPIEILARMAGRTAFRLPRKVAGAAVAVPVTPLDIAHAIAMAQDKLGARMAMAMACQHRHAYPEIERAAHDRLLRHLRAQRQHPQVIAGPYRFRARIALFDAFHNLVAPAQAPPLSVAARRARMQRRLYVWLERQAAALLEEAANTAAKDAVRYLFSLAAREHLPGRTRAVSWSDGQILVWGIESAQPPAGDYVVAAADLTDLYLDTLDRPRRAGVLTLNRGMP